MKPLEGWRQLGPEASEDRSISSQALVCGTDGNQSANWRQGRDIACMSPRATVYEAIAENGPEKEKRPLACVLFSGKVLALLLFCLRAFKFGEVVIRMPIRLEWSDIGVRLLC